MKMYRLKLSEYEKPWSETELTRRLHQGQVSLLPVQLQLHEKKNFDDSEIFIKIVDVFWKDFNSSYVFAYQPQSSAKAFNSALNKAQADADKHQLNPMVILPYLSEENLLRLEASGVSGIDLCGNGVIISPSFRVWRSGQMNRFKEAYPIQNVFRGESSLFGRCFILRPQFETLSELYQYAQSRFVTTTSDSEVSLSLGTASKVVGVLEEELMIVKEKNRLRLIDPSRLLQRLRENYKFVSRRRLIGRTHLTSTEIWQRLSRGQAGVQSVATGIGSAGRYGVISGAGMISLYTTDTFTTSEQLEIESTNAFPNIELIEDERYLVYFDARREGERLWASPIQTWIELANSRDARDREAALDLEQSLLKGRAETLL